MWMIKEFKTREQLESFIDKNKDKIQYEEIFVNNAYAVEYRLLKKI